MWHEFGDAVPDEGEYNLGYFEGKQHTKKWLVTCQDLDIMYNYFIGKPCINLWCDGRVLEEDDEEMVARKKTKRDTKRSEKEEELEDVFQQLKKRHGSEYSGPQLRLWARMFIAKTHDDLDHPPNVPLITGSVQRQPRKESLSDAFTSAACAIAKAFSPPPTPPPTPSSTRSPSKVVDIRMKNLEQLRCLQQLREDGILTEEEFLLQKNIVIKSLNQLV